MVIETLDIQVPILRSIGQIADDAGIEAHVVGGYVRDKLLGKDVNDIDIVVVGDGVAFAKEVARRLQLDKMTTTTITVPRWYRRRSQS